MRWGRGLSDVNIDGRVIRIQTYNLSEAGFRTTSLGILASGVREAFGGVFRKGGGNPGGKFPGRGVIGADVVVGIEIAGSIPRARSCSSKEIGSGTGVEAGAVARGC
jgi:hypothetical protein